MFSITDQSKIKYLLLILFLPVFLDGINSFLYEYLNITSSSIFTLLITGALAMYGWIIILKRVKRSSIFQFEIALAIFVCNFIVFVYSRPYLLGTDMILIYLFYLPISMLMVKDIQDWSTFFDDAIPFCFGTGIIGIFVIMLTNYYSNLNYMEYSYALLPLVLISYIILRRKTTILSVLSFAMSSISILIFGARAPILFIIAFILYCEIFAFKNKMKRILIMVVSAVVIVSFYIAFKDEIQSWALKIAITTESRFIQKLLSGELFISNGRDIIKEQTSLAISNMGLNVYGLFGDRYAANVIYSHNIVREILLSFGWVLGIFIIICSFYTLIRFYLKKPSQEMKIIMGVTLFGLFARYIISGSFVIEGRFYLCLAMMFSLMKTSQSQS